MALIELTPDDLCAALSSPFPCEEGTIIDPIAAAHALGLVETGASVFEDASAAVGGDADGRVKRTFDPRLVLLSLACSMEASQAVAAGRADGSGTAQAGAGGVGVGVDSVRDSLGAFVDGVIASPPVMTTVIPPAGTVVVIGTVVIKIPSPPPVHPEWEPGEQLARTDLLAMAARFQSASKVPGVGATAEDLVGAADRLISAAAAR